MVGVEEDERGDKEHAEEDDQKGPPGINPGLRLVRCAHYGFLLRAFLMLNEMGAGLNREAGRYGHGLVLDLRGAIFSSCS